MVTTGSAIADYSLESPLGSSGIATVYRASDLRSGRTVALKVLHAYFSSETALLQAFFAELERVRAAPHPAILGPSEWGVDNGSIWVASEYASEGNLRTNWRPPGRPEQTVAIVERVAEGLEHALARGLTHRDLKPSNIFYDTETGSVRIADFGVALLGENAHPLMRTALTTPLAAFMAPEYIADGHSGPFTEAFSLAVLAYWLLTGAVPYPSEAPSTMYAKALRYDCAPPSAANPAVSRALDRAVMRGLAPYPAVRAPSPGAFARSLREALPLAPDAAAPERPLLEHVLVSTPTTRAATMAAPSTPPPRPSTRILIEHLWRPIVRDRRKEILVRLAIPGLLLAAGSLGYAAVTAPPEIPVPSTQVEADTGPGRWVLSRADLLNSGHVPAATASSIQGQLKWKVQTRAPFGAAAASDGSTVFAATGDNRVLAVDLESGAIRWEAPTTGPVDAAPVVAGDMVYVGLRDKRVLALDRATGRQRWEFQTENPIISSGTVAGGVLYQGSGDGKLYALDASTGRLLWQFQTGAWIVSSPAILDDVVVVASRDGWLHFLDRATGRPRFIFYTGASLFASPAVSGHTVFVPTEGRRMYAVDAAERSTFMDRQIYWWQVQVWIWGMAPRPEPPKGLVWTARMPARGSSSAAVAGDLVYVGSESGSILALEQGSGKQRWEFKAGAGVLGSPAVSADAVYAAADNGLVYALDPATGELQWSFQTGARVRTGPTIVGKTLLVTSEDGALYALR